MTDRTESTPATFASKDALLPCPFCGGEPDVDVRSLGRIAVFCSDCGVQPPMGNTREQAWEIWNQRGTVPQSQIAGESRNDPFAAQLFDSLTDLESSLRAFAYVETHYGETTETGMTMLTNALYGRLVATARRAVATPTHHDAPSGVTVKDIEMLRDMARELRLEARWPGLPRLLDRLASYAAASSDELEAILGQRPKHECAGWDCSRCEELDNALRDLFASRVASSGSAPHINTRDEAGVSHPPSPELVTAVGEAREVVMAAELARELRPLPFDQRVNVTLGIGQWPRRASIPHWTAAERAISDALQEVEKVGAHVWLTDAVILLGKAQDRVADYVDDQLNKSTEPTGHAAPIEEGR